MRLTALAAGFALLSGWLTLMLLDLLCGYWERPIRLLLWYAGIIIAFALAYFLFGGLQPQDLGSCFYYSLVSATALGYGRWAPQPHEWAKALGAVEAVIGILLIALIASLLVRYVTR